MVNDRVADMLTRIRNANQMKYDEVEVLGSKVIEEMAKILKTTGFIEAYVLNKSPKGDTITITLKYANNKKERVITGLKRVSRSGLRVYAKNNEIPYVLNGLGIAIISTSQGLMTDKEARSKGLGGEVLAFIW